MSSESKHLNLVPTVVFDPEALKTMRFFEMVSKIEQMRATGRFTDFRFSERGVIAEMIA